MSKDAKAPSTDNKDPGGAQAAFDAKAALRANFKALNPTLTDAAIEQLINAATSSVANKKGGALQTTAMPAFKEPPRYKLLQKAYFGAVKRLMGKNWQPLSYVVLDPEEMPMRNPPPGAYDGQGDPERVPLVIEYAGIPEDHMEPLNDAAVWMMEHIDEMKMAEANKATARRARRSKDPIEALMVVGQGAEVINEVRESV